jgi:hypothetical protein
MAVPRGKCFFLRKKCLLDGGGRSRIKSGMTKTRLTGIIIHGYIIPIDNRLLGMIIKGFSG